MGSFDDLIPKQGGSFSDLIPSQPSIDDQLSAVAGATPQDIEARKQPIQAQPDRSLGEIAEGVGEVALTLGTGATTGLIGRGGGFLAGAGKEILSGEFGSQEAADRIEAESLRHQDIFTNTPESETGKAFLKSTGEFLEPLGTLPALAEFQFLGAVGGQSVKASAQALKGSASLAKEARRAKQVEGIQKIIDNPQSAKNVEFMIADGKRVKDVAAKKAISLGIDAPSVAFFKGASKADRAKFAEQAKIKERALDDLRFASSNLSSDVVGNSLAQRVNHLVRVNKSSGQQIDKVAKGLEGKKIDLSQSKKDFFEQLENEGVTIVTNPESGKTAASYAKSSFQDSSGPQKAINSMIARLDDLGESADARQAHMAKRFIDEQVTLGGKGGEGLQGRSQGIILGLRRGIDDTLDNNFRNYKRVNDRYAQTITALNRFQDSAGSKVDLTGPGAAEAIGIVSRRLLNTTQSRTNMRQAIELMESAAESTGAKFSDDIVSQAMFANKLDDLFGSSTQRGFASEVNKGVSGGKLISAAKSPVEAAVEGGINIAGKLVRKGDNVEKAFKSINSLISR